LRFKGLISPEENALYIAILLHDIGHGPFHMPWKKSIEDVHHEEISLVVYEPIEC
jgi:predicted HD phosphohydrolase